MAQSEEVSAYSKMKDQLQGELQKLSLREQLLILGGVLTVILFSAAYLVGEIVTPKFKEQARRTEALQEELSDLPILLSRYARLEEQKRTMESRFNSSDPYLDGPSYIEGIIKRHTNISERLRIQKKGTPSDLGEDFVQEAFSISFMTDDMKQLVQFLERTVDGPQPLLVTRIEIQQRSDKLNVSVSVSSIRRKPSGA